MYNILIVKYIKLLTVLDSQQGVPDVPPGELLTERVLGGDVDDRPSLQQLEHQVQVVLCRVV